MVGRGKGTAPDKLSNLRDKEDEQLHKCLADQGRHHHRHHHHHHQFLCSDPLQKQSEPLR